MRRPAGARHPPPPAPRRARLTGEGIRRLHRELTALARPDGCHSAWTLYPSDNISFIRLLLQGPEGSLYAGGVWLLYCEFPPTYPLEAPKARCVR